MLILASSIETATPKREFNTSRANKAVHDNSTVDFAYLPKLFSDEFGPQPAKIRVPVMPSIFSDDAEARLEEYPSLDAAAGGYQGTDAGVHLMKPQIETVVERDHAQMSTLSDVGDGHTNEMSIETLADLSGILGTNAQKFVDMVKDKDETTIRTMWNGFLDDLLGAKQQNKRA